MTRIVAVTEAQLDQILDASYDLWHEGLSRAAYGRFYAAQLKTRWGAGHLERLALVDGSTLLASAKLYALDGVLDDRAVRIAGIAAVFTQPAHRGSGHAGALVQQLIDRASRAGADLALLFSEIEPEFYTRLGFEVVPTRDLALTIAELPRRGAPATLIRAGEERDLAEVVAMGRVRAEAYRFHLDRDLDLVQSAIAKKRLLAGLGPAGARELQFFVAEEGAAAVAYVVLSVRGREWIVEECGDRDPSGARVGAILQGLLAREPAEGRPTIRAWLPERFRPPQITIADRGPSRDVMMIRALSPAGRAVPPLSADDVFYWRSDVF